MSELERLRELSHRLEQAISSQELPLAQATLDERLLLLRSLAAAGHFSDDLMSLARLELERHEYLTRMIEAEKEGLQQQLRSLRSADRVTQLYKAHSR